MRSGEYMTADLASFDLQKTSTLQAVATGDQQELAGDLQKRLEEAVEQAAAQPEVVQAAAEYQQAETALRSLQSAARALNWHVKELREQIAAATVKTLDRLIESASSGAKPDYTRAGDLAGLEHRERLSAKAIERLVEHLTPLALVARLRAEAHAHEARARALEEAAHQRAARVLSQLRDAVSDEVVLPVDLSKGVAGALMKNAAELRRLAREAAENAARIENTYMESNRENKQ
jgi:hypothetical protein